MTGVMHGPATATAQIRYLPKLAGNGIVAAGRRVAPMKHYRVNKVAKPGGVTLKRKDILASGDEEAVERAEQDEDCPTCEVYRDGKKVGQVL